MAEQKRYSDKNGEIVVRAGFFGTDVIVGGFSETGEGLNAIWREALRKASPVLTDAPRVLVLGLGGGGVVRELNELFPECEVSAVEHDPEMIQITHELQLYGHRPPHIVCTDALEALREIEEQYDLIIVDLFKGGVPSALLKEARFASALRERLAPGGVVLVNAGGSREYMDVLGHAFTRAELWISGANFMAMLAD